MHPARMMLSGCDSENPISLEDDLGVSHEPAKGGEDGEEVKKRLNQCPYVPFSTRENDEARISVRRKPAIVLEVLVVGQKHTVVSVSEGEHIFIRASTQPDLFNTACVVATASKEGSNFAIQVLIDEKPSLVA